MKKRILFCNEHSEINTGYATYGKQLLTHLYNTNKYEIAEFSIYGTLKECKKKTVPWKMYPNMPDPNSPEMRIYKQEEANQFGKWRFDRVCLDFKPDVVIDIRDFWMSQYEYLSPFRKFYRWMIMPPIDSVPIREEWLVMMLDADCVFSYSGWGLDRVKESCNNQLKHTDVAPYGLDFDTYLPANNKTEHKRKMGLPEDSYIIGSVMRNQVRKLYPSLLKAFKCYLETGPKELTDKSILYIHTSYPDKKAWDIPALLKEYNLTNRVYFSYYCKVCNHAFTSLFRDARTKCVRCGETSAVLPNVKEGYTKEQMIHVYQLFDLYVQYANAEGFGMPILEAAGCGVPVCAPYHSAMVDLIDKLNGYKINILDFDRIIDGNIDRAILDQKSFVDIVTKYFSKNSNDRDYKEKSVRKLAVKNFQWLDISKKWERAIDLLEPPERKWTDPPEIYELTEPLPKGEFTNKQFLSWCCKYVLNEPEKEYTFLISQLLKDLNYGVSVVNNKLQVIDRKKMFDNFVKILQNKNEAERARTGIIKLPQESYLQ